MCSPISIRSVGDWSMRNLCTGWLVYLYPSNGAATIPVIHQHIHECRTSLYSLKHSLWPRVVYYMMQATGQAPAMWPVPFGLTGRHIIREKAVIPLIKFVMKSCEPPSPHFPLQQILMIRCAAQSR